MFTTTTLLATLLLSNAFAEENPLTDLDEQQLNHLTNAIHEMDLDKIFNLNDALAACKQKRQAAQDHVNEARDEVDGNRKHYELVSAGANSMPEEVGGVIVGAAADVALTIKFEKMATATYDDKLEFKNMIDFGKYFQDLESRIFGELSINGQIDEKEGDVIKESVAKVSESVVRKIVEVIQHKVVQRALAKSVGTRAFFIAEEGAFRKTYGSAAEIAAQEAAIEELKTRFGTDLSEEALNQLGRHDLEIAAKAAWDWIPVIGQVASGGIAAAMMADITNQLNEKIHAEYMAGVKLFFDDAEESLKQHQKIFLKQIGEWIKLALLSFQKLE